MINTKLGLNLNAKFEVFKDLSKQYRFRLKAVNGEIIANSESYTSKQACMDTIQKVKTLVPTATIIDKTLGGL